MAEDRINKHCSSFNSELQSAVVLKCRTSFVTSQAGNTLIPKIQSVKQLRQSVRTEIE